MSTPITLSSSAFTYDSDDAVPEPIVAPTAVILAQSGAAIVAPPAPATSAVRAHLIEDLRRDVHDRLRLDYILAPPPSSPLTATLSTSCMCPTSSMEAVLPPPLATRIRQNANRIWGLAFAPAN